MPGTVPYSYCTGAGEEDFSVTPGFTARVLDPIDSYLFRNMSSTVLVLYSYEYDCTRSPAARAPRTVPSSCCELGTQHGNHDRLEKARYLHISQSELPFFGL